MTPVPTPSREEVLDSFAVEPRHDRATLESYLRDFPDYAADLIDLSRELSRRVGAQEGELSPMAKALIETAWQVHSVAAQSAAPDPLADLGTNELRTLAQTLDVPRQVVTAFRERRVLLGSVPRRFLEQFAAALQSNVEQLVSILTLRPGPKLGRSFKAEAKPSQPEAVTFERLLHDAGVPEARCRELLGDEL